MHVLEMVIDNAALSLLKVRRGCTPCRWVGVDARDARRGLASGPEPDVDAIGDPFSSVDATTDVIEAVIVGGRVIGMNAAAFVDETGFTGQNAAVAGVRRYEVTRLMIYTFDDVDFTV